MILLLPVLIISDFLFKVPLFRSQSYQFYTLFYFCCQKARSDGSFQLRIPNTSKQNGAKRHERKFPPIYSNTHTHNSLHFNKESNPRPWSFWFQSRPRGESQEVRSIHELGKKKANNTLLGLIGVCREIHCYFIF